MHIRWQLWNRKAKLWLWIVTVIGMAAAMPLGASRMAMEKSSNTVEFVFDYRDIVEAAEFQPRPQQFLKERLELLKKTGVTTMAVYESSLKELMQAGRLMYYNGRDAALLEGKLPDRRVNSTYVLFSGKQEEELIGPIVREAFDRMDITYRDWSFKERNGLIIDESLSAAMLKTLDFDPMALQALADAGFHILPRFSDRVVPYDEERTEAQLKRLGTFGITRVLFDGEKAKGAANQSNLRSLDSFGQLLDQYDIGLTAIENLKKPQQGIHKLAYLTNYNVVRVYSLSPEDSIEMTPEAIVDRFLLAAKDRNIRIFFLNPMSVFNSDTGLINQSVDKLASALGGQSGAIAKLEDAGFPAGLAKPFIYEQPSWEKPLRGVVALGAVAIVALLISAFLPISTIPSFVLGLAGAAGLYVRNSSLMEQALALGAAVSGPTLALIWVMNRIYSRTIGERRMVGGDEWSAGASAHESAGRMQWVFPSLSIKHRIGISFIWFIVATLITLTTVPLVIGLLNNITYSLVLEQFRGVSVLHIAPIVLVALYVLLYEGSDGRGVAARAARLLDLPIRAGWVLAAAVVGAVGIYYLSRTGNAGQVSALELLIRGWLESTFGVRPRFKEFMLGHPPLLLGLFLAFRYRAAWALIVVGALGQLTIVSTFTHIHTPLYISIVRTLLGLGTGIVIGCIFIAVWIVLEGAWRRWLAPTIRQRSE